MRAVGDGSGPEQSRRIREAVVHLVVVEEPDIAVRVAGDRAFEQGRRAGGGFRAEAVADEAPHRPARVQKVLGRWVPVRYTARRVQGRGAAAFQVLRCDPRELPGEGHACQPADSAACGLRAPIVTRAMMTMPRAMRYQTKGMKLLVEMNFMNQAMTA